MSVASKVAAVMERVNYLQSDKKLATGQRYWYLSEGKLLSAIHTACVDAGGLMISPLRFIKTEEREDSTSNGGTNRTVRILMYYRVVDPEDKDSMQCMVPGEASDTGDKVLAKCMTNAYKTLLKQLFMISSGEDPDDAASPGESPEDRGRRSALSITPEQQKQAAQGAKPSPSKMAELEQALVEFLNTPEERSEFIKQVLGSDLQPADMTLRQVTLVNEAIKAIKEA
jgi:hypothetical protein